MGNSCNVNVPVKVDRLMDAAVGVLNDEQLWRFEPEALMAQIKQWWPAVSFKPATRTSACSWWIRLPESEGKTLSGFLDPSHIMVGFEGYDEDCIEFALWLRRAVPETVKLLFADQQHGDLLPLTTATTADDIFKYVRSP